MNGAIRELYSITNYELRITPPDSITNYELRITPSGKGEEEVRLSESSGDGPPEFDAGKFEAAMRFLHRSGGIAPDDLRDGAPAELAREIGATLTRAVNAGLSEAGVTFEVSAEAAAALRENVWVFSGMKTFHELREASLKLVTEAGEIKPFRKFLEDVRTVHEKYNVNYLRAEYNFAVHSSLMAARWLGFEADGDGYNIQYRTAADGLVRAEHAALHGTTLPMNDPFWDSYLPPLGWNCRCTAVQVLREDYEVSDSAAAAEAGERATTHIGPDGSNKLKMFRFNPGKTLRIFPDRHPYYPRGCGTCDKNAKLTDDAAKRELCRVCAIMRERVKKREEPPDASSYIKHSELVYQSPRHGAGELEDNLKIAKFISDKIKGAVYLLPNLDPRVPKENALRSALLPAGVPQGKNPDALINGKLFEFKNMSGIQNLDRKSVKSAVENHIKKAKRQADNIVLKIPARVNSRYARDAVVNYLNLSKKDREIWIIYRNKLYKHKKALK